MTSQENLLRDINTLKESIQLNWHEIGTNNLTNEERQGIKTHLKWCLDELQKLYAQL